MFVPPVLFVFPVSLTKIIPRSVATPVISSSTSGNPTLLNNFKVRVERMFSLGSSAGTGGADTFSLLGTGGGGGLATFFSVTCAFLSLL